MCVKDENSEVQFTLPVYFASWSNIILLLFIAEILVFLLQEIC